MLVPGTRTPSEILWSSNLNGSEMFWQKSANTVVTDRCPQKPTVFMHFVTVNLHLLDKQQISHLSSTLRNLAGEIYYFKCLKNDLMFKAQLLYTYIFWP